MHLMMMSIYAAMAATVLAAIDPGPPNLKGRFLHGLKVFGWFLGIGLVLSWMLFPIPW